MRENRPYGSEGGEAQLNEPSLPLSGTEWRGLKASADLVSAEATTGSLYASRKTTSPISRSGSPQVSRIGKWGICAVGGRPR